MLDQRLGGLELIAADIGQIGGVDRRHTGIIQRLQRIQRARVVDRSLQHDVVRVVARVQVEDDIVVVDPHIIQPAPLDLLKQQLLLDADARAENAYSHDIPLYELKVKSAKLKVSSCAKGS